MISPALAAIVFTLVVLHRIDGYEVIVNPHHVTSLRAIVGPSTKMVAPDVHCVVGLSDRKFVSVLENCELVKQLLEQAVQ